MALKQKLIKYKNDVLMNKSVSMKEQFGYSGGIFGNAMGQDSVHTFNDKFNRNFMGISSGNLIALGNISTILGFIVPPVAGAWFDRPSHGKRSNIRTAIMTMPIPFAISSMLLFVVPSSSPLFNFIWVLFFSLLFSVVDTFYDIAMSTLALKLVSDPNDRKNFFTVSSLASTLGSMLPGWLIPIIVGTTDDAHRQQWLYFFVALGFCVLGIASMYLPYITIDQQRDMNMQALEKQQAMKARIENQGRQVRQWDKRTVKAIMNNRPFIILQISMIFDAIRQVTYKALPYLYDDVFDDYGLKSIIDMISGALSYIGLFAVPFVGNKISARTMMAGGYAYTAFFYLIISLFNFKFDIGSLRSKKWIIGILIGLAGMPNAAQGAARKIITADSTDYMEWYSEKNYGTPIRSDGILSATGNIVTKIVELLKTNLYNVLFALVKYKSKDPGSNVKPIQTTGTLKGLYMIITLCGLAGNALSAIAFLFDDYTGKKKDRIFNELCEMRAARENIDLDNLQPIESIFE